MFPLGAKNLPMPLITTLFLQFHTTIYEHDTFGVVFSYMLYELLYMGADKSLTRPGRKQATVTEDFDFRILFIIIIGGILVLFIYLTRLASNEIFSPSN
jgi:hypothetical protein